MHFRISDGRGSVRVVPDGARWEIEPAFDASTSLLGEEPAGLERRRGPGPMSAIADEPGAMTELQRQAAIDALLTVRRPEPAPDIDVGWGIVGSMPRGAGRRYQEARLEPGETVTIVGQALPWSDVHARAQSALTDRNLDRAISDDIARARASGALAASPIEAWGNAAIPGFGIGQPTRLPIWTPRAPSPRSRSLRPIARPWSATPSMPTRSCWLAARAARSPCTRAVLPRPRSTTMQPSSLASWESSWLRSARLRWASC